MTRIEKSVEINARPEEIWTYLTDPNTPTEWIKGLKSFDREGLEVGSIAEFKYSVGGLVFDASVEVCELETNKKYIHQLVEGDFKDFKQSFTYEPTVEGTRLIMEMEYELPYSYLGKALDIAVVERSISHKWDDSMERLKETIEEPLMEAPVV